MMDSDRVGSIRTSTVHDGLTGITDTRADAAPETHFARCTLFDIDYASSGNLPAMFVSRGLFAARVDSHVAIG